VRLFSERAGVRSNYWLQVLLLDAAHASQRDEVLQALNDAGYMSRPAWALLPHLPMYRQAPCSDIPASESLAARIINIPSSAGIGREAAAPAAA
jgi:perosamine synthetase